MFVYADLFTLFGIGSAAGVRAMARSSAAAAAVACLVAGGLTSTAGNAAAMTKTSQVVARVIIHPFLIYYGWIPRQSTPLQHLADRMRSYPVIVLGSGVELPADHEVSACRRLLSDLPQATWYGYVDIGVTGGQPSHTLPTIKAELKAWRRLGAKGVLIDCAGPSYGVTPGRLRWAVTAAHALSLRVLVNAFTPTVALHAGLTRGDAWLAENWAVSSGKSVPSSQEAVPALALLKKKGIPIWMTATGSKAPLSESEIKPWILATMFRVGGVAMAVSGPHYSSESNSVVPESWIERILRNDTAPRPGSHR